jgi:hypothetical protein
VKPGVGEGGRDGGGSEAVGGVEAAMLEWREKRVEFINFC